MTTFRIAFHLWLDGGQEGERVDATERAVAAAAEATATLDGQGVDAGRAR